MKKNFFGLVSCLILMFCLCVVNVCAKKEENLTIKKVVAVAYDDSGSMSDNDSWAYASYSLQNMIGLMNKNDELNVVRMSDLKNVSINLMDDDQRKKDINSVYGWDKLSGTDFLSVEIAGNWLKTKKDDYKNSQNVEFWLVVLTDGNFGDNQSSMESYFNNLKKSMDGVKFEGVFVAIGKNVSSSTKNVWNKTMKEHLISASSSDDIINAMNEVSGLILGQGGKGVNINIDSVSNGKGIKFETAFPLKKFVIFA